MGALTAYLQREFQRHCPDRWICRGEARLLSGDLARVLGYAPQVDLLLERHDQTRRLWIEFEISRADPVANHAKFATAHLFQPQPPTDTFVAMVSPHVSRGRRNLAANTVALMRRIGMDAFQTVLLPHMSPAEVQRLNHLQREALAAEQLSVTPEIERVLAISEPALTVDDRRIHFVGDLLEVMLNLRQWNEESASPEGRASWARRMVTYFVYDPFSRQFAPSKFCAYVPVPVTPGARDTYPARVTRPAMTIGLYVTLDGVEKRFDGTRARTHLERSLAMRPPTAKELPTVERHFERWSDQHHELISVHRDGPVFLLPPPWFR